MLLDFIEKHPTRALDRQSCDWVLGLGLDDDRLLDLADASGRRLVGCLFAGMDNPDGVAELLVLGYRDGPEAADVMAQVAVWARDEARRAGAAGVELALPTALAGQARLLEERGFRIAYELHRMMLEAVADSSWLDLQPPAGTRWVDLDGDNLTSAHSCYRRAFATTSGAQTPTEEVFRKLYLAADWRPRVLISAGKVVAYLRVTWLRQDRLLGEVRTVARDPNSSLAGLGKAAMAEALRDLRRLGARDAFLEVASDNERALALYRKLGFRAIETVAVHRLVFS